MTKTKEKLLKLQIKQVVKPYEWVDIQDFSSEEEVSKYLDTNQIRSAEYRLLDCKVIDQTPIKEDYKVDRRIPRIKRKLKTKGVLFTRTDIVHLLERIQDAEVVVEAVRIFLNEPQTLAGKPEGFLRGQLDCYDDICKQEDS